MPRLLTALVTCVIGTSFASRGQTNSPAAIDKPRTEVRPAKWLNISEALLLGAAVSLAVFSLQWRYGFNLGDEGWLWYISQRTALAEVPFRDFFSYDPGDTTGQPPSSSCWGEADGTSNCWQIICLQSSGWLSLISRWNAPG